MSFFNFTEPVFRRKQEALDVQDRIGLVELQLRLGSRRVLSLAYSRIDQVSVIWGLICATIFITAQLAPISWVTQAIWWTLLSGIGTIAMFVLAYFWVRVERLQWVLYAWGILISSGVVLTDGAIALSWGQILMHLCPLWLGICSLGYCLTGWGLRSRAFLIASFVHLAGMLLLPWVGGWQFLFTGLLMATNSFVFAETQWDMRLPIEDYALLSSQKLEFNRQQHQLRKA